MSARSRARVSAKPTRSRRLTHGPEEGAGRIAAAAQAVRRHLGKQRHGLHRRILGVLEAVRGCKDPEWYYVVIVQRHEAEWELLLAWAERGRWRVDGWENAVSWPGAVVQAMVRATRLER